MILELLIEKFFKKQTSDTVNITAFLLSDMVKYFGFAYLNYSHTFAEKIFTFFLCDVNACVDKIDKIVAQARNGRTFPYFSFSFLLVLHF